MDLKDINAIPSFKRDEDFAAFKINFEATLDLQGQGDMLAAEWAAPNAQAPAATKKAYADRERIRHAYVLLALKRDPELRKELLKDAEEQNHPRIGTRVYKRLLTYIEDNPNMAVYGVPRLRFQSFRVGSKPLNDGLKEFLRLHDVLPPGLRLQRDQLFHQLKLAVGDEVTKDINTHLLAKPDATVEAVCSQLSMGYLERLALKEDVENDVVHVLESVSTASVPLSRLSEEAYYLNNSYSYNDRARGRSRDRNERSRHGSRERGSGRAYGDSPNRPSSGMSNYYRSGHRDSSSPFRGYNSAHRSRQRSHSPGAHRHSPGGRSGRSPSPFRRSQSPGRRHYNRRAPSPYPRVMSTASYSSASRQRPSTGQSSRRTVQFDGDCDRCGAYGHKAAQCLKE